MHSRPTATVLLTLALLAGCGGHESKKKNNSTTAPVTTAPVNSNNQTPPNATLALAAIGSATEARIGSNAVGLVLELSVTGADAVSISSLTIAAIGSINEATELGALRLVGDDNRNGLVDAGERVLATAASPAFTQDDGSVSLAFTQALQIAPNARIQVLVAADVVGGTAVSKVGKALAFQVTAAGSVAASAKQQPIVAQGSFPIGGSRTLFLHDHLLISEVVTLPTASEYVEIFNPTGRVIDLSNYYLTDSTNNTTPPANYHLVPTGAGFLPALTSDYMVRFPAGSSIAPGVAKVIAIDGTTFRTSFPQRSPDFAMRNPGQGTAQMLTFAAGAWTAVAAGVAVGLTDGGEPVFLFQWDGQSDLVKDVDQVFWGTSTATNGHAEKTGVSVDGPDAGTTPSVYLADTPGFQQDSRNAPRPVAATSALQRIEFTELGQTASGGNGITGGDETSEPWNVNFVLGVPTPGVP